MKLSFEQENYVNAMGNTVLLACPGSGKTFAVAEKAKKQMSSWEKAHSGIAVLSFTNVAINEIIEIVQEEHSISYPHYFGTVDSFIDDIFLRYAGLFLPTPKRPRIVFDYIEGIYDYWRTDCYKKGCIEDISSFRWTIDGKTYHRNTLVECPKNKNGRRPCDDYKNILFQRGVFYQSDIPILCYRLLKKHPEIISALVKRYPKIIVDEAQDTSREQMAFFDMLCENGLSSLDLVGDPDQAIYEWRNATSECLIEKTHTAGWDTMYLTENRRSSQKICDATSPFSVSSKSHGPNKAVGHDKAYHQMPQLFVVSSMKAEDTIENMFIQKCVQLGIKPENTAILTRGKVYSDQDIKQLWKSREISLFARSAFEWSYGSRKRAYKLCEEALFMMYIDTVINESISIEQTIEDHIPYPLWKKTVLSVLFSISSADTPLKDWVASLRECLINICIPLPIREGHTIDKIIRIKKRDKNHPDFLHKPLKCYFISKEVDTYVRSSIHGVKGESFDAILLLALSTKGNTITNQLLCSGVLNCEMMRTAYVAMTRPRKYLAVAITKPCNDSILSNRFPQSNWEYVYID